MALKTVTAVSILVALLAQSAAAQDPAPGADPWSPGNVYYGATLVLAYADGNGKNFTPEQTKRFQLTVGWLVGMGQAMTAMETLDPTPRGRRCLGHFEHLSPADRRTNTRRIG
jgi:hypothetical protein